MQYIAFLNIFEDIADFFTGIPDMLLNGIVNALKYIFGLLMYLISIAICKLVAIMYGFFKVFSGMARVKYDAKDKYLLNVFFENAAINKAYWGFAAIAFVLLLVFVAAAIIRKVFDIGDKAKESYGDILMSAGKAILVIILMSFIMSVSLNLTNVLMQRLEVLFDDAALGTQEPFRAFSDEEFAYMNNALETIGNFSVNPSYTSRYNINACFNAIRNDLLYLQDSGVFEYDYYRYYKVNDKEIEIPNWQRSLQKIAKSADLKTPLKSDSYNDKVTAAIVETVEIMSNNKDFEPLQYVRMDYSTSSNSSLDVILFMTGTANAAQNSRYNSNASITDPVRGPYFAGQRSIYSYDNITDDFDIKLGGIDYTIIIILAALMVWQLFGCIMSCAVRIFNLLLIYLLAPPFAATIPWDNGQRFKSWVQAFTVQLLNVFGTVICMRLLMLYIPIILGDKLVLFSSGFLNLVGKAILIYAGVVACSRGADLFSGILLGNGGSASSSAGNMTGMSNSLFGGAAAALGGAAVGAVKGVAGGVATAVGLSALSDRASEGWKNFRERGGFIGKAMGGKTNEERSMDRHHAYENKLKEMDEQSPEALEKKDKAEQTAQAKQNKKDQQHKELLDAIKSMSPGGKENSSGGGSGSVKNNSSDGPTKKIDNSKPNTPNGAPKSTDGQGGNGGKEVPQTNLAENGAQTSNDSENGAPQSNLAENGASQADQAQEVNGSGSEGTKDIPQIHTMNDVTENGGAENGGMENGAVNNGAMENGAVNNGAMENGGANNGGMENGGMENGGTNGNSGSSGNGAVMNKQIPKVNDYTNSNVYKALGTGNNEAKSPKGNNGMPEKK